MAEMVYQREFLGGERERYRALLDRRGCWTHRFFPFPILARRWVRAWWSWLDRRRACRLAPSAVDRLPS